MQDIIMPPRNYRPDAIFTAFAFLGFLMPAICLHFSFGSGQIFVLSTHLRTRCSVSFFLFLSRSLYGTYNTP